MSVKIKGMDLPTSCLKCPLSASDYVGFHCPIIKGKPIVDSYKDRRRKECPLETTEDGDA